MGVQLPGFVDQYEKRLDAHLAEANLALSGFQSTADKYFSGSLERLIVHYRESDDAVFRQDADNLAGLHHRQQQLQLMHNQMQGSTLHQVWHLIYGAEPQVFNETVEQYSYTVPLTPAALLWGLALATLLAMLGDILLAILARLLRPRRQAIYK